MFFSRWFGNKPEVSDPKTIFIGLIGGVGDLVLAAPSVTALKRKYPEARIRFGVGPHPFHSAIKNHPDIDSFETPFQYNVWKPRERRAVEKTKRRDHDQVILLDNPERDWWREGRHLIDLYADRCGVTLDSRRGAMHLAPEDEHRARSLLLEHGVADTDFLVVLSPEARSKREVKEWPHQHFLRLIENIHSVRRVKMIALVSDKDLRPYPGTVVWHDPDFGAAAATIRRANAFIGLDNGLTHIAGAFGVNTVSIHIGFPPQCCGVISDRARIVAHAPFSPPDSISVEEVFDNVRAIL